MAAHEVGARSGPPGGVMWADEVGLPDRPEPPRAWTRMLLLYGAVLAPLVVLSWQIHSRYVEMEPASTSFRGSWFWDGWVRFDGNWYSIIAREGYSYIPGEMSSVAFFPAYPLAMRLFGGMIDNPVLAGVGITIACGALSLVAFHRWCLDRLPPSTAFLATLSLALYPYAFFLYGAVYSDAMFLLFVLVAFLAFERDRLLLAGVAGAVAAGTRLVGFAVCVGLVVGVLEQRRVLVRQRGRLPSIDLSGLRRRDASVLVSGAGLVAFSGWLFARFDDPLVFMRAQAAWGQEASWRTWFKVDLYYWLRYEPTLFRTHGLVIQAVLLGLALLAIPAVTRRFGWRYGSYLAVVLIVPAIGSQDFQGMGRYLLAAFPAFAVLGSLLGEHPRLRHCLLPISAATLLVFTGVFANARYIS